MSRTLSRQELLFGLLAVKSGRVARSDLRQLCDEREATPEVGLVELLIRKGVLSTEACEVLRHQVEELTAGSAGAGSTTVAHVTALDEELAELSRDLTSAAGPGAADAGSLQATIISPTPVLVGGADVGSSVNTPTHAGSSDQAHPLWARSVGGRTGRFRVLRPHAKGGLGEVSIALDEELHREVAFKEIQTRHASHPLHRQRFLFEAEVTGNLEHPCIVPVYGLGTYDDGRPYYAMRFIRGRSLKAALEETRALLQSREAGAVDRWMVSIRGLVRSLVSVCQAMQYAHDRGVLHRDLKPANIMLGEYGETLVVDWGLAKMVGREGVDDSTLSEAGLLANLGNQEATQAGSAVGTPQYMSPEQSRGERDTLGPACDIYSLGATLYHVIAGQPPYVGSLLDVLKRVQSGDLTPPRDLVVQIPRTLNAICLKAMAFKPAARYCDCRALANDLEAWLADDPVLAYRESGFERLSRWMRKRRDFVAGGVLAALALLLAAVAITVISVRSESAIRSAYQAELEERRKREQAELQSRDALATVDDWLTSVDHVLEEQPDQKVLREWLLQSASRDLERLIAEYRERPDLQAELARAFGRLGAIQWRLGQTREAIRCENQRHDLLLALSQANPAASLLLDLSRSEAHLALLEAAGRNLADARRWYDAAWRRIDTLKVATPRETRVRNELIGAILVHRGELDVQTDRPMESQLADLQTALTAYQALLNEDPHDIRARLGTAIVAEVRSRVEAEAGQWSAARTSLAAAITPVETILSESPANPSARELLAQLLISQATIDQAAIDPDRALPALERALDVYRGLQKDFPTSAIYGESILATELDELIVRSVRHEHRSNLARWPDLISRLKAVDAERPDDLFLQLLLVRALRNFARDQRQLAEYGAALSTLQEADRMSAALLPEDAAGFPEALEERIQVLIALADLKPRQNPPEAASWESIEALLVTHASTGRPVIHTELQVRSRTTRAESCVLTAAADEALDHCMGVLMLIDPRTPYPGLALVRAGVLLSGPVPLTGDPAELIRLVERHAGASDQNRLWSAWHASACVAAGQLDRARQVLAPSLARKDNLLVEELLALAELSARAESPDREADWERARLAVERDCPGDATLTRWLARFRMQEKLPARSE